MLLPSCWRVGTRSSPLALWQAQRVMDKLQKDGQKVELVPITTQGDRTEGPLHGLGIQGLFCKELELSLSKGEIHMAVHSLKDLPAELAEGLELVAFLPRGDPRDSILLKEPCNLKDISKKKGPWATGSIRRRSFLLHINPSWVVENLRGNIPTRLKKWQESSWEGIMMANVALERLEIQTTVFSLPLDPTWCVPAPCQGVIALEIPQKTSYKEYLKKIFPETATNQEVLWERTLLKKLQAGCQTPLGLWADSQTALGHVAIYDLQGQRPPFRKVYPLPWDLKKVYEDLDKHDLSSWLTNKG